MGVETPRIPVHEFMAMVSEFQRGKIVALDIANAFALSVSERTEALSLNTQLIASGMSIVELHEVLLLASANIFYTTPQSLKTRLGVS